MVNELRYNRPEQDNYHNLIPPTSPSAYTNEITSKVFRYMDGTVDEAPGIFWLRHTEFPAEGGLWWRDLETGELYPVEKYGCSAVFACNPHLPIMFTLYDPLETNTRSSWQLLQIFHPRGNLSGVSQIATEDSSMTRGGGLVRHAAGARPTWIPSLLPATYRSPISSPPTSRGLGGELAVILGLMALSAEPDLTNTNNNTNVVFLGSGRSAARWQNRRWLHDEKPKGYPQTDRDDPRGFLVNIFLDPWNPLGSTPESLHGFQWNHAVVQESRPSSSSSR
ncbi:hypothetical protein QQZ08_010725 [Neonectria magnoliae]|uniref:Uncharacterized protein n=1 Tax=Neonectria magnoliae TaxID=2732573 RepID=A0ABR1HEU0_9HYPO